MAPKNPDTRKQAVIALSLASSQRALFDQLEQMLQDKDVEVRETVAASLGEVYTLIALTRPKIGSTFVRKPRSPRMKITQFLAATLLSGSAAFAQIQTGRIAGTVYDPNKAVVPNATVIVTNTETKVA
jgi:HEAT repeat protein